MLNCPMCKKSVVPVAGQCPRCQADLALLCAFRDRVGDGLTRADTCLRTGSLDEAVWAYLGVLEVDPDNPVARQQVARVVSTIRQFDRVAPSRRWLKRLHRRERRTRFMEEAWKIILCAALLATVSVVSYYVGYRSASQQVTTVAGQ